MLAATLTWLVALGLNPATAQAPDAQKNEQEDPSSQPRAFTWLAFVDSYAAYNLNEPSRRQAPSSLRAFDVHNGFALAWAGFNLNYQKEQFGATAQLRFGPSAKIYNRGEEGIGLDYIKQAFASYKPRFLKGKLQLDLGKFNTPYGAEVAESQDNFNYSRGALNWLGQPFFHTGLRLNAILSQRVDMTLLAVNGWNNSVDNNRSKSFGIQFHLQPIDEIEVYVGYMAGPENSASVQVECEEGLVFIPLRGCVEAVREEEMVQEHAHSHMVEQGASKRWRHFSDLVISVIPHRRIALLANLNYGYDELILEPATGAYRKVRWYGAMFSANLSWTDTLSTAIRAEWYEDPDGATTGVSDSEGRPQAASLLTGTATLNYSPRPQLSFKLDIRHDNADQALFDYKLSETRRHQTTFALGMIVKTK